MTNEEIKWVNDIIQWSQTHENGMFFDSLATVSRLSEFVYDVEAFMVSRRPMGETARIPVDPSPPTTNTQGATP